MLKLAMIAVLSLMLLCMAPIMGGTQHDSGHLHHSDSVSCATCMVAVDIPLMLVQLSIMGFAAWVIPLLLTLLTPHSPFHPPRFRS